MSIVATSDLPTNALLRKYADGTGYTDCYVTEVQLAVSHAEFIQAFYTTPLFKAERLILRWFVERPSTDAEVKALAVGSADRFAAWNVETRADNQILLADFSGRTRSWLMTCKDEAGDGQPVTRLYFGSAVVPRINRRTGKSSMGFAFVGLLGFHRIYSRLLLGAACSRVMRMAAAR
jgi:hypothetical protein